jgi:CHAD domain-containing protein
MARRPTIDRLLAPRTAALAAAVTSALAGDPGGVHQARVASRRLREVVPVVGGPPLVVGRARRAVRDVTRALGPVRELDVSLLVYAALTAPAPLPPAADSALRRMILGRRATAMRRAHAALAPVRQARLRAALDALALAMPDDRPMRRRVAGARVVARAARLQDALRGLGTLYSPERLHAVRIAVKQLRYALEVAGAVRWGATAASRRELRVAQDLLGQAHDLHVLGGLVRDAARRVVTRSRAAAPDLGRLARAIDDRCRALHAAFGPQRRGLARLAVRLALAAPSTRTRDAA